MPLLPSARNKIRVNLQKISAKKPVHYVQVGHLTPEQLAGVNAFLTAKGFAPVSGEVFFRGTHIYDSRIAKDGYSIDDVIDQITNGMDVASICIEENKMSAIRNETERLDIYGSTVKDTVVFRCGGRTTPELYSVIPKGDVTPNDRRKQALKSEEALPVEDL
jgi:hypothetical protein